MSEYRRKICAPIVDAEWFDPNNKVASELRDKCNILVMSDATEFLRTHSNGIAIIDSTNPTHDRRKKLLEVVCLLYNIIRTL